MERILVGTDGSASALAAMRWGAALATGAGAQLTVAHVYRPPQAETDPSVGERARAEATAALAGWAKEAGLSGAAEVVVEGDARDELGTLATEHRADLLVVGARGEGGFGRLGLGSVAHHVAHHVECAIAVVPEASQFAAGAPIVAGVDGSRGSDAALRWAVDLAAATQRPVMAVLAYDAMADSYPHSDTDNWKYRNQAAAEALVERVKPAGVPIELRVQPGNTVEVLEDLAQAHSAAAVVVGTRSHGLLHHTFLGRVPMQLLDRPNCAVVVTRS